MSEHLLRQRKSQCHEEDRPVNRMEADNILADQVQISRPVFSELLGAVPITVIADAGDIVGECIEPHVYNMLIVKIYRDSPLEGRPGYAQILQAREKEIVHHLILAGNRLDELRMRVDVLDQAVRIFAHFKEICLFPRRLHLASAVRALAVHKL